jgi:hypothetical protein
MIEVKITGKIQEAKVIVEIPAFPNPAASLGK